MKRILLTGMSGTGKSTVISELAARGYKAVDADSDEFSQWVEVESAAGAEVTPVEGNRDCLISSQCSHVTCKFTAKAASSEKELEYSSLSRYSNSFYFVSHDSLCSVRPLKWLMKPAVQVSLLTSPPGSRLAHQLRSLAHYTVRGSQRISMEKSSFWAVLLRECSADQSWSQACFAVLLVPGQQPGWISC